MHASNQQTRPALPAGQHDSRRPGLAQHLVEAVQPPDGEHVRGVPAADDDHVLRRGRSARRSRRRPGEELQVRKLPEAAPGLVEADDRLRRRRRPRWERSRARGCSFPRDVARELGQLPTVLVGPRPAGRARRSSRCAPEGLVERDERRLERLLRVVVRDDVVTRLERLHRRLVRRDRARPGKRLDHPRLRPHEAEGQVQLRPPLAEDRRDPRIEAVPRDDVRASDLEETFPASRARAGSRSTWRSRQRRRPPRSAESAACPAPRPV